MELIIEDSAVKLEVMQLVLFKKFANNGYKQLTNHNLQVAT
jgi:hypothetical protein